MVAKNTVRIVGNDGVAKLEPAANEALRFLDWAVLCTNVYAVGVTKRLTGHKWEEWISRKKRIPLPPTWSRCNEAEEFIDDHKNPGALNKMVMEVWRYDDPGQPERIVLVYRGTANLIEWVSNLNWFIGRRLPFLVDKFKELGGLLDALIPHITQCYPNAQLVAAGHSLGGGLAQFSAYRCDRIKLVYAFNPSPVTGFYSVPKERRRHNKSDVVIYRVYNRGEALAIMRGPIKFLRNRVRRFFKPKPHAVQIFEYGFRFEWGNPLTLHGSGRLAWYLAGSVTTQATLEGRAAGTPGTIGNAFDSAGQAGI